MYVIIAVCFVYKALNNNVDFNMEEIKGSDLHCHDTRNKQLVRLPLCRTNWGHQTSHYMFFNEWNNLPPFVKDSSSFLAFKNKYVSVCNE